MVSKKIENYTQDAILAKQFQAVSGRLGTVINYDVRTNTATVAISSQQTDEVEDILKNVMCPMTLGVQSVAPNPGTPCWVVFKDNNLSQPLITHYYNHRYEQHTYTKQTKALNMLPTHLLSL